MSISGLAKFITTETEVKKRRFPQCTLCKNHGLSVLYRGHKRKCRYALCVCQKCMLTKERRRVMSWHVYEERVAATRPGHGTNNTLLQRTQQEYPPYFPPASNSITAGVGSLSSSPAFTGFQALMPYTQQTTPTYSHPHHQYQHFHRTFEPYDGRPFPFIPPAPPPRPSPYGIGGGISEERSQNAPGISYPNCHPMDPISLDWSQESSCGPPMYPFQQEH